jgi:two-component system response regulator YesN
MSACRVHRRRKESAILGGLLVVDDDIETRQTVQDILSDSVYRQVPIFEAGTAERGVKLLKDKRPSIVLTDLSLPDMDGIQFGQRLLRHYPNTCVIAVTHLQMFEMVQACINTGFSGYLLKPIVKNHLMAILERLFMVQQLGHLTRVTEGNFAHLGDQLNPDLSDPVHSAMSYIELRCQDPITLKDVSDFVYLSPSYFSRVFKEETGVSFVEFLTTCRLEKAKSLLKQTSMPIDVIASQIGFSTAAYFSTTFRRKEGKTPSEYRRMVLGGNEI